MDILIAGCGDVGTRLGLLLVAQGHRVWGIRRESAALPDQIRPLILDMARPFSLAEIPPPELVFYTASAGGREEAAYRRAYLTAPAFLMQALAALPRSPRRLFFTSSTGVYGQADGSWVDEQSPTCPKGFSGQIMLQAEALFAAADVAATSVRFSGIYGPGRDWLLSAAFNGVSCPAVPPRYTNRIHVVDCAAVLAHLATLDRPDDIYLASDNLPVPKHEVLAWLADRLGAAGLTCHSQAEPVEARMNKRCANARLLATGFRFNYPDYQAGYGPLVETWAADKREATT